MSAPTWGEVTSLSYPSAVTEQHPAFEQVYPEVFGLVLKYTLLALVAVLLIGVGLYVSGWALLVSLVGLRLFVLSVDGYWWEKRARSDIHKKRVEIMQARADRLRPARMEYRQPFRAGVNVAYKEDDKPPESFIRFVYGQKVLRGEGWLEANTEFKSAGRYLRVLAEQGFIEGRDASRRIPGALVGSLDDCVAHFWARET